MEIGDNNKGWFYQLRFLDSRTSRFVLYHHPFNSHLCISKPNLIDFSFQSEILVVSTYAIGLLAINPLPYHINPYFGVD